MLDEMYKRQFCPKLFETVSNSIYVTQHFDNLMYDYINLIFIRFIVPKLPTMTYFMKQIQ